MSPKRAKPAKKKVKAARKTKAKKAPAKRAQKAPKKKAANKKAASPAAKKAAPHPAMAPGKGGSAKAAKAPSKAAAKGAASAPARGATDHDGMEFENEPPATIVAAPEPHIPTPSRRKPKPGSPDWPGESLTVGMEAPAFSLPSTLGRKVTLAEFRGKRVVLYFYPKDDTPGCTMEACAFRDNLGRIVSKDAVVLGISMDDDLSHQRFAQKYNLQFPLLSDVDAAVCRKYGTYKEKNLYGRSFWGVERTTFVIDREGKVENVFRRVKVEGHADEVLATLSV